MTHTIIGKTYRGQQFKQMHLQYSALKLIPIEKFIMNKLPGISIFFFKFVNEHSGFFLSVPCNFSVYFSNEQYNTSIMLNN